MEEHSTPLREQSTRPQSAAKPSKPRSKGRGWLWLVATLLAGAGVWYLWSKAGSTPAAAGSVPPKAGKKGGAGAAPVVAVTARKGSIGVYINGLGTVTPIYTVTVKSRVDGQLMSVHYSEGDIVHKGDPLVEIDPRPYQVALEQAEGQMARDQATLENAKVDLDRYQKLLAQNAIPEQQLATQKATVLQAEGVVKTDQGTDRRRQAEPDLLPHPCGDHRARGIAACGPGQHRARHRRQRHAGDHRDPADQRDLHGG
jgi:multidrug efflux system membrane fusion protein